MVKADVGGQPSVVLPEAYFLGWPALPHIQSQPTKTADYHAIVGGTLIFHCQSLAPNSTAEMDGDSALQRGFPFVSRYLGVSVQTAGQSDSYTRSIGRWTRTEESPG